MSKYKIIKLSENYNSINIIGMIRMRNESLILNDTLNHFSQFVDGIIIFDDASTDNSIEIARKHSKVLAIISNTHWEKDRVIEETRHRQALLEEAKKFSPQWMFYSDCDERFEGNIKEYLLSEDSKDVDAIRIKLFDAYITDNDQQPYRDQGLYNFRKYFGPERRDILMIWRNKPGVEFIGLDKREPKVSGRIITKFYCQHYGKSLSIEHWEDTCDYYINFFTKYSAKWQTRKGKAIHELSDFGRELYVWEEVKDKATMINKKNPLSRLKNFISNSF